MNHSPTPQKPAGPDRKSGTPHTKKPIPPPTPPEATRDAVPNAARPVPPPRVVDPIIVATIPLPPEHSLTPERLAAEIRAKHRAVRGRTLLDCRALGEWLLKAKATVGHGKFLKWVKEECGISNTCARDYMKIAKGWGILEAAAESDAPGPNARRAVHFSIRKAIEVIDASLKAGPEGPTTPLPSMPPSPATLAKKLRRTLARSFGPRETLPPVSKLGLMDSTWDDLLRLAPRELASVLYELSGRELEVKDVTAGRGGKPS